MYGGDDNFTWIDWVLIAIIIFIFIGLPILAGYSNLL